MHVCSLYGDEKLGKKRFGSASASSVQADIGGTRPCVGWVSREGVDPWRGEEGAVAPVGVTIVCAAFGVVMTSIR